MKVLISDNLSNDGIEVLKNAGGIIVDVKSNLSHEELKKIIKNYDVLVIRSSTKVTKDIIQAAEHHGSRFAKHENEYREHEQNGTPSANPNHQLDCRFGNVGQPIHGPPPGAWGSRGCVAHRVTRKMAVGRSKVT